MKQAVVLIHGIGEQKPMSTLRSFVSAILPPAQPGLQQYRSKPDRMSELFELRRLTSMGRFSTDFYEYYWAYHIEGTTWWHLFQWFKDLLLRPPIDVPTGMKTIWWTTWTALGGSVSVILLGYGAYLYEWFGALPYFGLVGAIGLISLLTVQGFVLYWLGDAARYLSPSPSNIALRQRIRTEGLQLLRHLHKSNQYDRIVVVGHSLGSVIGYDLITRLWLEVHTDCDFRRHATSIRNRLTANKHPQPLIGQGLLEAGSVLAHEIISEATTNFRACQLDGWKEQRRYDNPWRISDFVTVGSPLAHALLLLASDSRDFDDRKQQRELPTCPPVVDNKSYGYTAAPIALPDTDREYTPHLLHHAAAFAVTRWSNLYFPAYAGLFGDFIGGPLRKVLGFGIQDIPVRSRSWRRFTPLTHSDYWNKARSTGQVLHGSGLKDALEALKDALGLNRLRDYHLGTDNRPVGTTQSDAESAHLEGEDPKSLLTSG